MAGISRHCWGPSGSSDSESKFVKRPFRSIRQPWHVTHPPKFWTRTAFFRLVGTSWNLGQIYCKSLLGSQTSSEILENWWNFDRYRRLGRPDRVRYLPLFEPSICFLKSLTLMPCRPIPSLIESMRSAKALLPSRRTSLGGPHVVILVNVGFLGSDEDMTTRKAQEIIAAATFSKVEGHLPSSVGPSFGRDAEAEGRSERTNNLDEWVQVTDGFGKLRTRPRAYRRTRGSRSRRRWSDGPWEGLGTSCAAGVLWAAMAEVDSGKTPIQIVTGPTIAFLALPSSSLSPSSLTSASSSFGASSTLAFLKRTASIVVKRI